MKIIHGLTRLYVINSNEFINRNNEYTLFFVKKNFYDEEEEVPIIIRLKSINKSSSLYEYIFIDNILAVTVDKRKDGKTCVILDVDKVIYDYSTLKTDDYNIGINVDNFFSTTGG